MPSGGGPYRAGAPDHFTGNVNTEAKKRDYIHQLEALGYTVTLKPAVVDTDEGRFAVVTAKTVPTFTVEHDGVVLRLAQALSGTGDHVHDLGVLQQWVLRLQTEEPKPLDVTLDVASDLQHLVSIAVGKTATSATEIHRPVASSKTALK